MKLTPVTVRLGGENWTIREWGHLRRRKRGGECVYLQNTLRILPGMEARDIFRIMVHELLHIAMGWIELDPLAKDLSETMTAAGIAQVHDGKDAREFMARLIAGYLSAKNLKSEDQEVLDTAAEVAEALHCLGYCWSTINGGTDGTEDTDG